ncbi:MAG: aminotransferase class I/II-fold pyridoxal phosphate-dependent enzyme [Chthonomonas sp.]|nr:aminotransferase class I/II-fold pyridoxal phosphate-dependent enzyme [Chthonomonas sp.]
MERDTIIQHLGEEKKGPSPVVPPIVQTSLFVYPDLDSFWGTMFDPDSDKERYIYSRVGNPTLDVAAKKIAALEHTESALLFNSGMSAITSAMLSVLSQGGHVVYVDTIYGPSKHFIEEWLPRFGMTSTAVDGRDAEAVIAACRPETQLIYLESPSSIVFRLQDVSAICCFAKEKGIATLLDNSYASPLFQQPAAMGVDFVVHSATKYLAGHSDVVAGVVAGTRARMTKIMEQEGQWLGTLLPPFPAWLLLRGLRTLSIRMKAAQETGNAVCDFLKQRPEVEHVLHVGDSDYDQKELRDRQMSGTSSLLSFRPKVQDFERLKQFVHDLEIFQIGVSWGGFESLALPIPLKPGDEPSDWVIRLYCGLEDPVDLCKSLATSLEKNLR